MYYLFKTDMMIVTKCIDYDCIKSESLLSGKYRATDISCDMCNEHYVILW